jgi:hypothetical protein
LGEYYSTAANADALADSNGFAIANFDIFAFAFCFAGGIAFCDVRVSDREPEARQVNTSAARAKRVLLMQLHAAFTGLKSNEVSHETLVVLAAHRHRGGLRYRSYLSRDLGA